jgi:hypothetical protein
VAIRVLKCFSMSSGSQVRPRSDPTLGRVCNATLHALLKGAQRALDTAGIYGRFWLVFFLVFFCLTGIFPGPCVIGEGVGPC